MPSSTMYPWYQVDEHQTSEHQALCSTELFHNMTRVYKHGAESTFVVPVILHSNGTIKCRLIKRSEY